jgi:hypothetical protein
MISLSTPVTDRPNPIPMKRAQSRYRRAHVRRYQRLQRGNERRAKRARCDIDKCHDCKSQIAVRRKHSHVASALHQIESHREDNAADPLMVSRADEPSDLVCPGYGWAAWHAWRASRSVARDVAAVLVMITGRTLPTVTIDMTLVTRMSWVRQIA